MLDTGYSTLGLELALLDAADLVLKPPSGERASVWAERNLELPRGRTSKPGPLTLYPFQREILDAMAQRGNEIVVVKKSARVGYTQILALAKAYHLRNSAAPILSVFPTEGDARKFERNYIRPLVKHNRVLGEIIPDMETQPWAAKKTAIGSEIDFKGAVDPKTFRDYSVFFGSGDEIDASSWDNAKDEGDKLTLFKDRFETYSDGTMALGSTPTTEHHSRINRWYLRGDQRRRFVPCPHCGEFQVLEWGGRDEPWGVKWPHGEPERAYYVCRHSGCIIEHHEKSGMDEVGEWRATAVGEPGIVSFHISALYSQMEKAAWGRLAREFVEASHAAKEGDKSRLQAFVNTKLGECWSDLEEEKGIRKPHELSSLCQIYQADVPSWVQFLTAGGDTQSGLTGSGGYRELSIYGWGAREKPALIGHWKILHPIETESHEQELAGLLTRAYRREDGRDMHVQAACIDGGGHYQTQTVDFCNRWKLRSGLAARWFPIKGWSAGDGKRGDKIWKTPIGTAVKTYSIEVNLCKDATFNKLHGKTRPDLIVFPTTSVSGSIPIDASFFDGLTKEKKGLMTGRRYPVWTGSRGNEPWDCLQYAFAAVQALKTLPAPNPFIRALDGPAVAPILLDQEKETALVPPAPRPPVKKSKFKVHRSSW